MTLQYSDTVRFLKMNHTINMSNLNPGGGGAAAAMYIRAGAPPAGPSSPITGTQLANFLLPVPAWTVSAGVATLTNTWQTLSAVGTGTAGWFYIGPPDGNTIIIMGSVGLSGSGADMIVDNTSFLTGQAFSVLSFTMTEGNA